jgi:hypothetical protein
MSILTAFATIGLLHASLFPLVMLLAPPESGPTPRRLSA